MGSELRNQGQCGLHPGVPPQTSPHRQLQPSNPPLPLHRQPASRPAASPWQSLTPALPLAGSAKPPRYPHGPGPRGPALTGPSRTGPTGVPHLQAPH